ncbi:MAG: 2,6-beta-D-fructofuranosidase [Bacteroidaceae bacterium]|nr:2,6-beta-D-fructofuranosidase [Bacteroidaceae bacterium]
MKTTRAFLVTLFSLLIAGGASAQTVVTDSVKTTSGDSNRDMLMNAASASQPRVISLGLPTNKWATIYEDGLPVSHYMIQIYPYKSWHGGVSHEWTGTMTPQEMVLRYGTIAYGVDSKSKLAGDEFEGKVNYTVNHFGRQAVDANISSPIGKGWGFSLGSYQNFDPGSNHLDMTTLQDRVQFYKASISKTWNEGRGKAGLIYQYSQFKNIIENYGPFIFVGDGSVKELNDFNLGIDQYLPANNFVTFMDVETGQMMEQQVDDANTDKIHNVNFVLDYLWDNGTKLSIHSKYKRGSSYRSNSNVMGVNAVAAGDGYTYEDGRAYEGYAQSRRMLHFDAFDHFWMVNAELTGKSKNRRHSWRGEVDYWLDHGGTKTSMYMFAHEVKKDPKLLLLNGSKGYNYNSYAEYYNGHEHKLFGLFSDEWNVSDRLWLYGGVRLEYIKEHGTAAHADNEPGNIRHAGFFLNNGEAKRTKFDDPHFNYSYIVSGRYTLMPGFGLSAEYSTASYHSQLFHYGTSAYPMQDPMVVHYFRGGVFWKNSWIDLTSQITNITMSNQLERPNFSHVLVKDAGDLKAGMTETVTTQIAYDIATLGWVTDAVITPLEGLSVHAMLTVRSPKYKNFILTPTFSDGVMEKYDLSDKYITALSKVELELEPSYSFGDWRVWFSARYFSKQYINKTNSLYFNGRWETFGGVDYKLNDHVSFSGSVVNILNQKGASGSIASADLVTDATPYKNYIMAGTFIRPFTLELTTKLSF